jgi:MOSC domain-containing protein YiiM
MSVLSVAVSSTHVFSKSPRDSIRLLAGLGVEGDCHAGVTVQHRSRLHIKPPPANLRQVHLIHSELFEEVQKPDAAGVTHAVQPGDLGENITTAGLDILGMSEGTLLHFVDSGTDLSMDVDHAIVRVTGLRNPCPQIQKFQKGLQERCILRDADRMIVGRKAGIMAVVVAGGEIKKGAKIIVQEPESSKALVCV